MDINTLIDKKSYASTNFVELKEILGDIFCLSKEGCINFDRINNILKNLYNDNYDIKFYFDNKKIIPMIIVYYPQITIRNNYRNYILKDIYLIYHVSEVEGIISFYDIKLVRNSYSIKEIAIRYTHSHVSSSVYINISESLNYNEDYNIINTNNHLCLGTDNVEHIISSFDENNNSNELYEYFFKYMDEFICFENILGIYSGQTIDNILGIKNSSKNFEKHYYINNMRYYSDVYKYINNIMLLIKEEFSDFSTIIKKLKINENYIEVLEFTDLFIERLTENTKAEYGSIYKKEGVFYKLVEKKNGDLKRAIKTYENYQSKINKSKIGINFKDEWRQISLIEDINNVEEEVIDNTYKLSIPPEIESYLLMKVSFLINNLYYYNYARKQNFSE